MTTPLRLLFDVDGVLASYHEPYVALVNQLYGTSYRADAITECEIERSLGLSQDQIDAVHHRIKARGYAQTLKPFPGAINAVSRLLQEYDVYFVTSPFRGGRWDHLSWTHDREWWLQTHLGVSPDRVVHTSAKHLIRGDVFIDDKPSNVEQWTDANPEGWGLLWYQPYNYADRGSNMVCHSWEHLTDLLELIGRVSNGESP